MNHEMEATCQSGRGGNSDVKSLRQLAGWPIQGTKRRQERLNSSSFSEGVDVRLERDRFMEAFIDQDTELTFLKQGNDMFSLLFLKGQISLWVVHSLEGGRKTN